MVEPPLLFDYLPNYAVPPGETLKEVLDEQGINRDKLAQQAGLPPGHINLIVNGHARVGANVAVRLERATNIPARFWLKLETDYQERLARLDESALQADLPLLEELPIVWMVKHGVLTKRLGKADRLRETLMYLGVSDRNAWFDTVNHLEASFRMSKTRNCDPAAVAVWLRMGEIAAAGIDCAPWDASRFAEALRQARSLTSEPDPAVWHSRLVELCASAGVAVVTVPEMSEAKTDGAARWLTPTKGLIQLSTKRRAPGRGKRTCCRSGGRVHLAPLPVSYRKGNGTGLLFGTRQP